MALPMGEDRGTQTIGRDEERSEGGACATFAKIAAFATLVSLVVIGAMHMSCGSKSMAHQQTNQLRAHEKKHSYWQRGGERWGRHGGHHHGDSLPGPHHVPHDTMNGLYHHEHHDQDLPEVLRHPLHKPGKNQAVVKVHREQHPNPGDLPELKKTSVKLPPGVHIIRHPPHVDELPNELRHPHHQGKQNTVVVKKAEPEDFPAETNNNNNEEDEEIPAVIRTHARTNGNGQQGTYKVHAERHSNKPEPREVSPSSSDEDDDMTDEEWDAKLDEEIAELEADFEHDFYGEEEEAEEDFDMEEDEDEFDDEEDDDEFDDELEIEWDEDDDEETEDWDDDESESIDEAAYDSEDEENLEENEEEWEDEVLDAVEEIEENNMIVVEERIEEP